MGALGDAEWVCSIKFHARHLHALKVALMCGNVTDYDDDCQCQNHDCGTTWRCRAGHGRKVEL